MQYTKYRCDYGYSIMFLKKNSFPRPHFGSILKKKLTPIFEENTIKYLFLPFSLSLEALVLQYLYPEFKTIILTPWLRPKEFTPVKLASSVAENLELSLKLEIENLKTSDRESFKVFKNKFSGFKEVLLYPDAFNIVRENTDTGPYYYSPPLRVHKFNGSSFFEKKIISKNRKIIFIALGSQSILFEEKATKLYKIVFELAKLKTNPDWYFIFAIGNEIQIDSLYSIQNRIEIHKWVPQLEILEEASLMITHGGLGTLKECIHKEVPVIVSPMIYDQPEIAKRVEFHKIGREINLENLEVEELSQLIKETISSTNIAKNIKKMKETFESSESEIIDNLIK